jgi:tetratricopeptide (TPR) repeat protein
MKRSGSAFRRTAAGAASAALTILSAVLPILAAPTLAAAQPRCAQPAAIVRTIDNDVRVVLASSTTQVPATRDMQVCAGDTIQVAARSRAIVLITASNTLLAIDQNSLLEIAPAAAKMPYVRLLRGALLFITRLRRSFEVRTPFVNASVEGTEFVVRVGADRATVTVLEGRVRATRDVEFVDLFAGEQTVAVTGQPLQKSVVVRPRDAVQWALYYEPVTPAATFADLDAIPAANQDAAFFVRRAGLLLGMGQLEEARADLDRAEKLNPSSGDVDALRAITAVALNDKTQALASGRRAVERAPNSAAARLALSYALQANFQLEEARREIQAAVATTPNDAALLARLAELRLMLDDIGGAGEAAEDAAARSPRLARAQTVLGFTRLAQLRFADARRAFEEALNLGSADPLTRVGLGLVKIRLGNLDEGTSDLELAAALNPDNALVRSYLGNAYLEDRRYALAEEQFTASKLLDPQDPTPWLYGAIGKQSQNRPAAAIEDLDESIAKNSNRAVYRSRLLLDGDLAVRGTHLSRVYGDLGFDQLALTEGWKSVNLDPTNHAAHRLLADNYLALPSHQIARDSELLQSQLLQPVNLSPVQPRLAFHGLNFLEDLGISRVGMSEFTRLFASNGIRVIGDGLLGQQDTAADNAIVSGLFSKVSFSVGQFHYQTDGIRENHDLRQDIANIFAQADVTHSTSVLFEYRRAEESQGDRTLLFDPAFFNPLQRSTSETGYTRVSARHRLTPNAMILGTYAHGSLDSGQTARTFEVADEAASDFVEVRFLGSAARANFTAGIGRFHSDGIEQFTSRGFPAPPLDLFENHTNLYGYTTIALPHGVAVTAGLSGDIFEAWDLGERRQISPKFGAAWSATPTTTVRGAVYRVLDRTLIAGQTLEPTQVSGFNQFFDDGAGARSWRYGIGVDQRINRRTYIGAEYSGRDLAVPVVDFDGGVLDGTVQEHLTRAYLYSTVGHEFAWSLGYQLHKGFDPEGFNPWLLERVTTHRIPAELRFVHRAGAYGRVRVTAIRQSGVFRNAMFELFEGRDTPVVTDVSVGYKLPARLGLVAVDFRNVFDQRFRFQDTSPRDPTIVPSRQGFVRLLITF